MEILFIILLSVSTFFATGQLSNREYYMGPNTQRWRPIIQVSQPKAIYPGSEDYFEITQDSDGNENNEGYMIDDRDPELESSLPYGIQNVRDLSTRSHSGSHKTTFQSLCPAVRERVDLNMDGEYEYRPAHYEKVTCMHPYSSVLSTTNRNNKICNQAGFTCIQLNRTIFLTRKARGTDCWETDTRVVPAGCECMWPKHVHGDILAHH